MEQLAPHEKLYVDSAFIDDDENHGQIPCQDCHGGVPDDPNWKTAHKGLVKDPTYPDPSAVCGSCHEDITEHNQCNLHVNIASIKSTINKRCTRDTSLHAKIDKACDNHCSSCHSSCGQCHVSRPESVKGGLLEGHVFKKRPPMREVCTACHGSRIGKEYFGENEGIPADIHKEKYFKCGKCHTADEMHATTGDCDCRFDMQNGPKCLDCHEDIYKDTAPNAEQHSIHKDLLSCQVCHSMPYKNCYGCHVGKDKNDRPYFKTDGSEINFKIGINPLLSPKRPERFVTVRHVPTDRTCFDCYAKKGLENFDQLPTWKLATPHNIRRQTPQNTNCNTCHGNTKLFLLKKDVAANELQANKKVIVPLNEVPEKIEE